MSTACTPTRPTPRTPLAPTAGAAGAHAATLARTAAQGGRDGYDGCGSSGVLHRLGVCGGMRWGCLALWGLWGAGAMTAAAQPIPAPQIQAQTLQINNPGASNVALVCPSKGRAPTRPAAPPAEPTEIPDNEEVEQARQNAQVGRTVPPPRSSALRLGHPRGWRIAVWGDSHMAAAFFSDQLVRQWVPADALVSSRFIHAGVGHGGVRALVRKTCLSGDWAREMAYAHADAAATPGPGMTTLVAKRPGASLALDLADHAYLLETASMVGTESPTAKTISPSRICAAMELK